MSKKIQSDNRSQRFVFVPFCLMCQAFQATGIVKYDWKSSIRPVMDYLMDEDINLIQLPCSESSFECYATHLVREPKGLKYYDTEKYRCHCQKLARDTVEMMCAIVDSGYEVLAILGIENSPSCAIHFIYSNQGMLNRKGIFMEYLSDFMRDKNLDIPFVGMNRKSLKRGMNTLISIVDASNSKK